MGTRYKIIPVSAQFPTEGESELNSFLSSNKIVSVEKHFYNDHLGGHLCFVVSYLDGIETKSTNKKSTIDYKDILSAEDFQIYSTLRELRKEISKKEGKPAYAIFTNEQLAQLVTKRVISKSTDFRNSVLARVESLDV